MTDIRAAIETDKGWLLIYHAVEDRDSGKIYHASAALVDKKDPQKFIGKLKDPLFSPKEDWELQGDVNNVVFPTGAAVFDDRLYIYYGAADKRIACASMDLAELLDELIHSSGYHDLLSEIGFTAGKMIGSGKKAYSTDKNQTKRGDREDDLFLMAIGWLAREGKIDHVDGKGEVRLKNKD